MQTSGYKSQWMIVFIHTPSDTSAAKTAGTKFRHQLINLGFSKLQSSCYMRPCPNAEFVEAKWNEICKLIPGDGEIRLISITDKQFERQKTAYGHIRPATPVEGR